MVVAFSGTSTGMPMVSKSLRMPDPIEALVQVSLVNSVTVEPSSAVPYHLGEGGLVR